ncbi:EAGR box-containing protein, partial [Mycoplasmoides alvi]|uniref:EAGR box-containing protein n=1 Tax=Mycoplasmoides alvi TaxID=78580 RepID=UPI00051ACE44
MFISNKSKKNNQKSVSNVEYESGSSNKLKLNNNSTSNENSLIDYTREIFENDYEKHFKKLNNVPSFPINIPVSFEFVPFFNSEIDDMNQNFNTKKPSDNFAQNSSNNNVNNNSNNSHTPQQLNQQLQLANQLQMMQYRAFLMAQQNNFLQQQLMMNNAMNPFAFNMYHQPNSFLMQQQMMANNQVNPNGLVVQQPKSELTELANIVSQVGKMMNTFQNQMVMQNNILVSQQKQVLQQQEIINKLHDKLFKGDLKQITSNTKEAEDEIEEEYLEPSETIDVLEDKFHSEDYLAKKKFLNKQTLFNEKSKLNHNVTNNLSEFSLDNANEYSSLTSEIEITDQKQIEKNKTNLEESVLANNFKKENNLEEFVQPTDNFLGFDNKELNQLLEEKKFKKLLEESKSNPSQRFWEPLVGQTKYGFYNNRVWHWLGYFDRFANWHPYKNAGEMPTLPTLHNGLINQDTKNDTLFWKRLVDNPNYGHREDGVWIWDGVFDQKLNWIPDPTADKYVLDHYAKLNKSLDSQKTEEEFFVTRKHDLREINETPHLKNDFSEHHHHHHHQHESLNENVSVNDANSFAFLPKENASKDDYQPSVEVKLVENDKITKKEKIDNVPPQKEDFVLDIPKVELEKFEPTRVNLNYDESKLDNKVLPNSTLNASELKPDSIDKNTFVNNESIVNDLSKQEVVKESKINEVVESLPADKIILNANNEHLINNEIKENISLEETISSNVSNDLVSDLNHNDVAKEEPVVEEVVEQPIQEEVVTSNEPVAEEVVEQPIEEEVSFDDVP